MSHPDDGQLHALVDGELTPAEAAALQAHLDDCAPCRTRLAEARSLLGECDRIVATLDVPPRTTAAPRPRRRPTTEYRMLGLAASALLVVTIGWAVLRPDGTRAPATEAPAATATTEAPGPSASAQAAPMAAPEPARRKDAAPATRSNEAAPRDAAGIAPEEKREMQQEPDKEVAGHAAAAPRAMRADTPPTTAKGVELNDLPPWKAKVAAPSPPPATARFHVDGLDVVSSTPLPGGGMRLVYSVNGTPVEFDQVPTGTAMPAAPGADIHELRWPRDGFDLTLRSRLGLGELELLRQRVR